MATEGKLKAHLFLKLPLHLRRGKHDALWGVPIIVCSDVADGGIWRDSSPAIIDLHVMAFENQGTYALSPSISACINACDAATAKRELQKMSQEWSQMAVMGCNTNKAGMLTADSSCLQSSVMLKNHSSDQKSIHTRFPLHQKLCKLRLETACPGE